VRYAIFELISKHANEDDFNLLRSSFVQQLEVLIVKALLKLRAARWLQYYHCFKNNTEEQNKIEINRKMNFNLHKIRYKDWTDYQYLTAVKKYYDYLNSIDFRPGIDLLKYFGDSFFHEGGLKDFSIDFKANKITMLIYRDSDREDINSIREKLNLKTIDNKQYQKDPILYQCIFKGIRSFSASVDFTRLWLDNEIMDTETTYNKRDKKFKITIGFWEQDEICFNCDYCTVKILNPKRILDLTDGKRKTILHCECCKVHLLTKEIILERLNETDIKLEEIKKDRRKKKAVVTKQPTQQG
ncbi:MAG: hypothetical protein JXA91_06325, partial [Candidatus Thermoplasmatota archaeon]|nr:hypothetical protein [Candidatus Thermoplasmatota archaeon]